MTHLSVLAERGQAPFMRLHFRFLSAQSRSDTAQDKLALPSKASADYGLFRTGTFLGLCAQTRATHALRQGRCRGRFCQSTHNEPPANKTACRNERIANALPQARQRRPLSIDGSHVAQSFALLDRLLYRLFQHRAQCARAPIYGTRPRAQHPAPGTPDARITAFVAPVCHPRVRQPMTMQAHRGAL